MLRSVRELIGYTIRARDGEVGQIVDFYFDDERWTVRYLVVSMGTDEAGAGSSVLLSPMAISLADFDNQQIEMNRFDDKFAFAGIGQHLAGKFSSTLRCFLNFLQHPHNGRLAR